MANYTAKSAKKHRIPRRVWWVFGALVVLVLIAIIAIRRVYFDNLRPVSSSQQVTVFTIASGESSSDIATSLQKDGLIRSGTIFQWYISSHEVRSELQAGTYALKPSFSVQKIVKTFVGGNIATNYVTIIPGERLEQIRTTFIKAGFNPTAVDAALKPSQYVSYKALTDKPAGASLEGFLYPDSFQKDATTTPTYIVEESLNEMAKHLTPNLRASFASEGLSVYKGITLASIVEQEVPNQKDRAQVAQVFFKRLKTNMSLGSDVTAYYGSVLAGKPPSTTYDSPYNTLLHKGLPPGPISNVSDSSLQAVAHPAHTDWMYFVSGDNGVTHFSKTLSQHQALTQQYCHKLCSGTQ